VSQLQRAWYLQCGEDALEKVAHHHWLEVEKHYSNRGCAVDPLDESLQDGVQAQAQVDACLYGAFGTIFAHVAPAE